MQNFTKFSGSKADTLLGRQQEINASHRAFPELSLLLTQLSEQLDLVQINPSMAPTVPPSPESEVAVPCCAEPCLNPPAPYSGVPNSCRSFLSQCSLTFPLQPSCFPMESSKVAFSIKLENGEQACGTMDMNVVIH